MGGQEAAEQRLDNFFIKLNDGRTVPMPSWAMSRAGRCPWEYIWAGEPARTQDTIRRIQNDLFTDKPSGLPGNDDGGATSSWYVFSAIGLYPEIPGVAGLAVGSPRFPSITIRPTSGQVIQIDALTATVGAPFVQDMTLNGKLYDGAWIPWDKIKSGGTLRFRLGIRASPWGQKPSVPPPSFDAAPNVSSPAIAHQ